MVSIFLMKIARQVVEHVMSQLNQQVRVITDQAMNPMQVMVQQVTSGIWRGQGADAFVQDVNNLLMPNTQQMTDDITRLQNNIRFALDTMQQADVKANTSFQQLGDVFAKIF